MGASGSTHQKLPKYSISPRGKLTLRQHVVGKIGTHFPPELRNAGKAELIMLFEVPNEGSLQFVVTASLQKLRNGVRVVLLGSGWMYIVRELQLKEGDKVRFSLLSRMPWTYSMEVERAPEADQIEEVDAMDEEVVPPTRMIPDLKEPVVLDEEINLRALRAPEAEEIEEVDGMDEDVVPPTRMIPGRNEPVPLDEEINLRALEADEIKEVDAKDEDVVPPTRMIPDLNEPVPLDKEINLKAVRKFDLNEPAHPDM